MVAEDSDGGHASEVGSRGGHLPLLVLTLITLALHGGLMLARPATLTDDRDGYLALGLHVAAGDGLTTPNGLAPTAFRPPLLPLCLAGLLICLPAAVAVAVLQLAGAVILVVLTVRLAKSAGVRHSNLAGLAVIVEPVLLQYGLMPMTELLAAVLLLAVFVVWTRQAASKPQTLLTGVLLGLLLLCRPSYWPGGLALMALWSLSGPAGSTDRWAWSDRMKTGLLLTAGVAMIVMPWAIRNQLQLGAPIFTTTHGGYTLHLGNNPDFDRHVVRRGWRSVWSGDDLAAWQSRNLQHLQEAGIAGNEVASDRWHYAQATEWIRANPTRFLAACRVRLARFWALEPLVLPKSLPAEPVRLLCLGYYGGLLILSGIQLMRGLRRHNRMELAVLLFSLSLTGVHAVYWSNMRFRSVISPLLAVLAAKLLSPDPGSSERD